MKTAERVRVARKRQLEVPPAPTPSQRPFGTETGLLPPRPDGRIVAAGIDADVLVMETTYGCSDCQFSPQDELEASIGGWLRDNDGRNCDATGIGYTTRSAALEDVGNGHER